MYLKRVREREIPPMYICLIPFKVWVYETPNETRTEGTPTMTYYTIHSKLTGAELGTVYAKSYRDAKLVACRQLGLRKIWSDSFFACAV